MLSTEGNPAAASKMPRFGGMKMSTEAQRAQEFEQSNDRRVCTNCAKFRMCMVWRALKPTIESMFPSPTSQDPVMMAAMAKSEDLRLISQMGVPIKYADIAKICADFQSGVEAISGV